MINIQGDSATYTLNNECDTSERWIFVCQHDNLSVTKSEGYVIVDCPDCLNTDLTNDQQIDALNDYADSVGAAIDEWSNE